MSVKFLRTLAAPVGALVLLLAATGCDLQESGAAAVVGDVRITENQVNDIAAEVLAAADGALDEVDRAELARVTVDRLVTAALIDELAERKQVTVTPGAVATLINDSAATGGRAELERMLLTRAGVPPREVEEYARHFLLLQELAAGVGTADVDPEAVVAMEMSELAADLGVKVNPRYGAWDLEGGTLVVNTSELSRPLTGQ